MASSGLRGLNLIQPESPPSNLTDAQDLLSAPLFPDLAAQLDLWTHVNFASDEPFISARDRELKEAETEASPRADSLTRKEAAHQGHFTAPTTSPVTASALPQQQQFDFSRFLAEFGLTSSANAADGLALQNTPTLTGLPPNFTAPNSFNTLPPAPAAPAPAPAPTAATTQSESTPAPPAKRARTTAKSQPTSSNVSPSATPFPDSEPNTTTPLTAAEDKRRRNTAASARFRLKKKEREAALDARAQALEDRVTALERECEGLRRENGWLRGLVVGVTGGVVPTMNDAPILPPPATPATATAAGSEKRKRDEESA